MGQLVKDRVLAKNMIMQYLMVVAQYVFPLITFPYLTRILGNEAYGIHTYMTSFVTYFQLFVDFGFILSSTKQIAQMRDDKAAVQRVFSETILAKLVLFIASLIILSVLIPCQPILNGNRMISYLYMGTVFFSVFTCDFLFRGLEKMEVLTYRFVASKFVSTCFTFILVKNNNDLIWVPVLNTAGSFVAVLITWMHIYKKIKIRFVLPKVKNALYQIKKSVVYFVSNIATTAFGAFTTVVMGFSLSAVEISFWGSAYNLISTVQALYAPIINSVFPNMVKNKDVTLIKKLLLLFMPVVVLGCLICFFGAKLIINLLCGPEYLDAIPVFKALIPVLLSSFPAMLLGFPLLGAMGHTKEVTKCTVIAAIYHILGIAALLITGSVSLMSIAILRSSTELLLLGTRVCYCIRSRKDFTKVDI